MSNSWFQRLKLKGGAGMQGDGRVNGKIGRAIWKFALLLALQGGGAAIAQTRGTPLYTTGEIGRAAATGDFLGASSLASRTGPREDDCKADSNQCLTRARYRYQAALLAYDGEISRSQFEFFAKDGLRSARKAPASAERETMIAALTALLKRKTPYSFDEKLAMFATHHPRRDLAPQLEGLLNYVRSTFRPGPTRKYQDFVLTKANSLYCIDTRLNPGWFIIRPNSSDVSLISAEHESRMDLLDIGNDHNMFFSQSGEYTSIMISDEQDQVIWSLLGRLDDKGFHPISGQLFESCDRSTVARISTIQSREAAAHERRMAELDAEAEQIRQDNKERNAYAMAMLGTLASPRAPYRPEPTSPPVPVTPPDSPRNGVPSPLPQPAPSGSPGGMNPGYPGGYAPAPGYAPNPSPPSQASQPSQPPQRIGRNMSQCISYDRYNNGMNSRIINSCNAEITYTFCWVNPHPDSFASALTCGKSFGGGNFRSSGSEGISHSSQGGIAWFACEGTATISDYRWNGSIIMGNCRAP